MFERAAVSKKRWRASVKALLFSGLIYPISQLAPLGRFISFAFGLNVAKRYDRLLEIIDRYKCRRIMEIGTYDGEHAKQMIETAKKHFPANEVEYYGFDLFELLDEHKLKEELSKKPLHITSLSGSLGKQEQRYSFLKETRGRSCPGLSTPYPQWTSYSLTVGTP
jgi:hypothetical protein